MNIKLKLQTQIFIGLFLGALCGYFFKDFTLMVFPPIGDVFIRMLKMLIVPLVFASMIVGMGSIGDIRSIGKVGGKTFAYFIGSTMIAVVIGLVLVSIIKPGVGTEITLQAPVDLATRPVSITETLVNIVPKNIVSSLAKSEMLPIILFALLVGAALTTIKSYAKPVYVFFESLNMVMMQITDWVMMLAPYGVFALIATTIARTGLAAFKPLTMYILVVVVGLLIHGVLVVPIILMVLGRYSPKKFLQEMFPAIATVFSTASSAAAMPIVMDCLIKKVKVSNRVVSFLVPLGTTMNMNGTALYQGVAVVFFAQIYGIELTLVQMAMIVLTATLAAIAAAGIPSAGFVTMVLIMNAVNVPIEGIGFILGVDRFLDMLRSTVNLWSNATGAVVVARLEGEGFD
jgi:Na+/H+-dicarboxylate symporter